MKNSVAVIGAGITGLTAAFRLKQNGFAVTLFEASARPGGVIRSIQRDGWLAECGPNTMLETSPRITHLVEDPALGIADRRRDASPLSSNRFILKSGKPMLLPGSTAGFMKTRLFSRRSKLRLLAEPFIRGRAPEAPEESLADFVRRRIGPEFLDYAINPFVAGVYAGDPEKLSVQHGFPKLHALEQEYGSLILGQILGARKRKKRGTVAKDRAKQLSFDQGLQVLPDALASELESCLRLNAPVTRVLQTKDGHWGVEAGNRDAPQTFDSIILSLPAHRLAELEFQTPQGGQGPADSQSLSLLKEVYYPPVASVVLGFRRQGIAHPLDGFGTLNPEVEKVHTLGTLFTSTLFPDRAPPGHVLLTTYLGGARQPELALKREDERVELVLKDLRAIYGAKEEPIFTHSFLYKQAIPQYEVGYGRYLRTMERFEADHPGIHLAGHCRDGISLADSILSGEKVAEKITMA